VQEEVMTWFKGQAADFYDLGIHKLVPRHFDISTRSSTHFVDLAVEMYEAYPESKDTSRVGR